MKTSEIKMILLNNLAIQKIFTQQIAATARTALRKIKQKTISLQQCLDIHHHLPILNDK